MSCFLCGSPRVQIELRSFERKTRYMCSACGKFTVTDELNLMGLIENFKNQRHLLSALTRQASDSGNPLTLTTTNLQSMLDSAPQFSSPLENIKKTLLLIMSRQSRADDWIELNADENWPLAFAHDAAEYRYFIKTLKDQRHLEYVSAGVDTLTIENVRLTASGWQYALEIQKTQRDSDQAFVAMWFSPELNEVWENGFKPALEETKFKPYRADLDEHNEKVDDRIIAEIRRSGLLVADFTGHRGGVYFEAGFALGLGIPVIWTCRKSDIEKAHFDTRQYNHITWEIPEEIRRGLVDRIRATVPGRSK